MASGDYNPNDTPEPVSTSSGLWQLADWDRLWEEELTHDQPSLDATVRYLKKRYGV